MIRCRLLETEPHRHGVRLSDVWVAEVQAAVDAWVRVSEPDVHAYGSLAVVRAIGGRLADRASTCVELEGEKHLAVAAWRRARNRSRRAQRGRTAMVLCDTHLDHLTKVAHLALNAAFYTLAAHPRVATWTLEGNFATHVAPKRKRGPLHCHPPMRDMYNLSAREAAAFVKKMAKRLNWAAGNEVAVAAETVWQSARPAVECRNARHHWLDAETTPGIEAPPLDGHIGLAHGTTGVRYVQQPGATGHEDAASLALIETDRISSRAIRKIGGSLTRLASAVDASMDELRDPAHTSHWASDPTIPADSENGSPFPYVVRVQVDDQSAADRLRLDGFKSGTLLGDLEWAGPDVFECVVRSGTYRSAEHLLVSELVSGGVQVLCSEPAVHW